MGGGRAQKEEGGPEKAGKNSRPRDEEEKDDHGYTDQSHRSAEIEYRHGRDKEDTGTGTEELGRPEYDRAGKRRRGGGKSPKYMSAASHAALHPGGGAQPLRLLVDARDRGCERAAVAPAEDSRGHAVAGRRATKRRSPAPTKPIERRSAPSSERSRSQKLDPGRN
jgi:hypothetical protein